MKQILLKNVLICEYEAEEWATKNPCKIMGHFYYDEHGNSTFTVWDDKEDVIIEVSTAKS